MARIALSDARGPLTDLLQKLGGENGEAWLSTLDKMLRNGVTNFPTEIVKLGTCPSVNGLSKALVDARCRVGTYAAQILEKVAIAPAETDINLVNVSVGDLGFKEGASREKIYARALELGLDLVPAEAGPQLRLQYAENLGENMLMAMEPIADSDGDLHVLSVGYTGDRRWLNTNPRNPATSGTPSAAGCSPAASKISFQAPAPLYLADLARGWLFCRHGTTKRLRQKKRHQKRETRDCGKLIIPELAPYCSLRL